MTDPLQPVPPEIVGSFWGVKNEEMDPVVQSSQFEKNKSAFYADPMGSDGCGGPGGESFEDAAKHFYGWEEPRRTGRARA